MVNQGVFSDSEEDAIKILLTISSSLSFCGNLFIIVSFITFRSLRSNVTSLLVFLLSVSDLVSSANGFLVWFNSSDTVCTLQAFSIQFWEVSAILWSSCIAFHAFQAICRKKRGEILQKYIRFYFGVCFIIPAVLAAIPFGLNNAYGFAGVWCWITIDYSFLRFIVYYVILFILWLFNVFAYLAVLKHMKKVMSFIIVSAHKRISLFILMFILCKFPGLVNRLLNIIYPTDPVYWLYVAQAVVSPLQGFGNSVIYGNSKSLQYEYKNLFHKCFKGQSAAPFPNNLEDDSATEYQSIIGNSPRKSYTEKDENTKSPP